MQETAQTGTPPEGPGSGAWEPCHGGTHQLLRFSEPIGNSGHMGVSR